MWWVRFGVGMSMMGSGVRGLADLWLVSESLQLKYLFFEAVRVTLLIEVVGFFDRRIWGCVPEYRDRSNVLRIALIWILLCGLYWVFCWSFRLWSLVPSWRIVPEGVLDFFFGGVPHCICILGFFLNKF